MGDFLARLADGDMRTTGASDLVVEEIKINQALFDKVVLGLLNDDPGLRMRCADAIEKASRSNPGLLEPHKTQFLGAIGNIKQQEVQWHVAQVIPRLTLTNAELKQALSLMEHYYTQSSSNIVRVNALQAIIELSCQDKHYSKLADQYIQKALDDPSHSLQARARKLVKRLV
jgi:hypothetical protein